MKKYHIILVLSVLILLGVYFLFNSSFYSELFSNKGSITSGTNDNGKREDGNTIAYGLKNVNGENIDNGSVLNSENNEVTVYVSLDHNINEDREYGLLVFEDYKQKKFKVENNEQELNKYFFEMRPRSSLDIKVSAPIKSNSSELTFLLVKKPEYKLKENDLNRAAVLEEVLSMRYSINKTVSTSKEELKEGKSKAIKRDGLNDYLFVTNSTEKLQFIFTETEGEKLTLSAGNDTNTEIRYAILALKDWEQDIIIDNNEVLYTTVPPESRRIFDFKLPNVERESNFQFIALPFPYEVSSDNYMSQQAFSSFRIVIQNKE